MHENTHRSEVLATIPPQCDCLIARIAGMALAGRAMEIGLDTAEAVDAFSRLLGSDCEGQVPNPNSRGGCMPEQMCGHPGGSRFLMDEVLKLEILQIENT